MGKPQRGVRMNEERGGKRFTYLSVSKGMFKKRVEEPTENSTPRVLGEKSPNAGKTIHEESFNEVVGQLLDIKVKESSGYGKSWEFYIDSSTEEQEELTIIQTNYASGYAGGILKRLPNLDLSDDVLFLAYKFTPKGEKKERVGISLSQWNDKSNKYDKVLPFYTKDNKNGLPELKEVEFNGQKGWDSSEQMAYLLNMVETQVKPNLDGVPDKPQENASAGGAAENKVEQRNKSSRKR